MAFTYSRSLTIDHTKCGSTDSTNFPVLVSLSHSTLKIIGSGGHIQNSTTQAAPTVTMPADLVFTSDSAGVTKIPWEVEFWDSVSGILVVWVNIGTVSHTVDTPFYMFYGDSTVTTAQNTSSNSPANVWDANFKGVYHLGDGSSLGANDSTTNGNNGTITSATAAAGQIDGAASFGGAAKIALGTALNPASSGRTYEAWVNASSLPNAYNSVVSVGEMPTSVFTILVKSNGKLALYLVNSTNAAISYDGTGSHTLSTGTWYHIVLTYNSTSGLMGYVNGEIDNIPAANGTLALSTLVTDIGDHPNITGRNWNGLIDEVRISNVARSVDWVLTEYNNQNAPGNIGTPGFIIFSEEIINAFDWFLNLINPVRVKNEIISYFKGLKQPNGQKLQRFCR